MTELTNFSSWWIEAALFVAVAALLPKLLRFNQPRALLWYWQTVALAAVLLGPASIPLQTRSVAIPFVMRSAVTSVAHATGRVVSLPWFLALMIAGSGILCARLAWGLLALRRLRQAGRPLPLTREQQLLITQLAPRAQVWTHLLACGPASFGLFRPVVLLPEACLSMNASVLNSVLIHELLHIQRHDWALHVAEELVRAALWFHPATWYVIAQIRLRREQTVDLEAVALLRQHHQYAEALLHVAQFTSRYPRLLPAPPFSRKHQLVSRIQQITQENPMTLTKARLTFAALLTLLTLTGAAVILAAPMQSSERTYGAADGIEVPKVIYKTHPVYPASAKDAKVEGTVKLSLIVSKNGTPYDIRVSESADAALDQAAIDAVQAWRFAPGLKDGKPVLVSTEVEITFTLLP